MITIPATLYVKGEEYKVYKVQMDVDYRADKRGIEITGCYCEYFPHPSHNLVTQMYSFASDYFKENINDILKEIESANGESLWERQTDR